MKFEWDAAKAASNLRKHRIAFADAIGALQDQHRLERVDERPAHGEERTQVIGMARHGILFVVTTLRDEET